MELTTGEKEEVKGKPERQLSRRNELLDIQNPRFLKYAPSYPAFQSHVNAEKM